ncbi:MAG: conjugal transfer protein TraB [Desulfobacterales bacterium]
MMGSDKMDKVDEQILRAAKEIVVKFIETGRVSPTTFSESFKNIYTTIKEVATGAGPASVSDEDSEK